MADISALTWWLAVVTILIGIQTVAVVVIAVRSLRLFGKAETTLDNVDRTLEPIADGTQALLGDLHALRETAQRAERGVSNAIDRVGSTTDTLKLVVFRRFWPVVGAFSAARAIARTISARRKSSQRMTEDDLASARFVAEGGPVHDTR